jgi:hypothetical protein
MSCSIAFVFPLGILVLLYEVVDVNKIYKDI